MSVGLPHWQSLNLGHTATAGGLQATSQACVEKRLKLLKKSASAAVSCPDGAWVKPGIAQVLTVFHVHGYGGFGAASLPASVF